MFNKFKKAVTYICKKIKQGVKIMAEVGKELVSAGKDIVNTVGCKAVDRIADHADKKLDMVERAGSALCNGAKGAGSALCNEAKGAGTAVREDIKSLCSLTYNAIKSNKIPVAVLLIGVAGSLVCSEIYNK